MPYYRIYFRTITGGKVKRESVRLDASSKTNAKEKVIKGEKPKSVIIDKVVKV